MKYSSNSPEKFQTKSSTHNSPIDINTSSTIKPYLDRIKLLNSKKSSKYKILLQQNRTVMNAYNHFQKIKIDQTA